MFLNNVAIQLGISHKYYTYVINKWEPIYRSQPVERLQGVSG